MRGTPQKVKSMSLRLPEEAYRLLCRYVLKRDGYRCRSCNLRQNLSVHHIVFRSQGGVDESSNLIFLCTACHDGLHTAVQDGVHGLSILPNEGEAINADLEVKFLRAPWWRPL
jgi:5-methylcytosine-specific restriction endonuclease McrA